MSRTTPRFCASLTATAILATLAPAASAQIGTLTTVGGRVVDLSVSSSGDLLFCTAERDVGTITTGGAVTVLADIASGPFPAALRGVLETPAGDVAVLDISGDVYTLPGGLTPAVLTYPDLYMIQEATDFVVDATGSFVIASRTPTSGVRGVNWVSADGQRWAYYLVNHSPLALAADALNGDILMADTNGGGQLRFIDTSNEAHETGVLDNTTLFGTGTGPLDGDMAVEVDGSTWIIGGGTVYRHDRGTGVTSVQATGFAQLRGIAIAASSGSVPSASGFSVYLAEGHNPTSIREIGNAGAPASLTVGDLGTVPDRGNQVLFFTGQQVFEMAVDLDGNLLVGGHLWGSNPKLMRVNLPAATLTTVAVKADGLGNRIEGIYVDTDGSIYLAYSGGRIDRITENPLTVTTVFSDTGSQIGTTKDMIRDRDGSFLIADREDWDIGQVDLIDPLGTLSPVASFEETRGIALDPFTGDLLVTEWINTGFEGRVGRLDLDSGVFTPLPKFEGMNYTNAASWGDGDLVQDVEGNIYTVSEDDWCVYKYSTEKQLLSRIGSGYKNHPSGCVIAKSINPQSGDTGWSLYVAEFDWLWEIPDVPAPASTRLDRAAPPTGRLYGYLPGTAGEARSIVPTSSGNGLLVTTSNAEVFHLEFTPTQRLMTKVLGVLDGLNGDLVATTSAPDGTPYVINSEGQVWLIERFGPSFTATMFFADSADDLQGVTDMAFTGTGNILIHARPTSAPGGKVYSLNSRTLELQAYTNRGERMAFDPLTGDAFVTQQGAVTDGGGEILRIDTFQTPAAYGHYRGDEFFVLDIGERGGGISFDDAGNFYVSTETDGRVLKFDRATGTSTIATGNYMDPTALIVADGRAGFAGPLGTSLFVLDHGVVYEAPALDLPAPAPPAAPPGLAPPAELQVHGTVSPGAFTSVTFTSPGGAADAGKILAVYSSLYGKIPGVPMSLAPDPTDPRIIPVNYDPLLWRNVGNQGLFPGLFTFLDGTGSTSAGSGFLMPNDPYLMTLEGFVDMVWLLFDPGAQNGIETIGGTTHLYIGY